ncbi:DUF397 domain-containing protein [Streptomyces sp. A0642]|uniref:DUF397 domain-containing protein n=1 Tax=Streptomyces sp. A0642 TaxID=2563100 RepID=UPI0010A28413|nr:DUF397 domain-containing protein [Streptomyces sp. A0642]THA78979.1 DUF397 domain-containing protein [Streptomyces sp. A0642]
MSTTPDLSTAAWRTSSYSNGDGGECVEIAGNLPGIVPVRDSKAAPGGPALTFATGCWAPFMAALRDGSL